VNHNGTDLLLCSLQGNISGGSDKENGPGSQIVVINLSTNAVWGKSKIYKVPYGTDSIGV